MPSRRHALVASYLAVLCAPVLAMLLHAPEHPIEGAFPATPRAPLSFANVRSEEYQTKATAWFEATLGLRSWSVWIDDTLLYHLFYETKWGSHVELGRNRILFERDDIDYFNRAGSALPVPGAVDAFADEIETLQRRMQRDRRALVPIFLPSKTTFYRDAVPPEWTRDLGTPRPGEVEVYRKMKAALEQRGVVFIDGVDLLARSELPREVLWGRDARHFSAVAGCVCMARVVEAWSRLTGRPAPAYPCTPRKLDPPRDHGDLDLFRLLNAWGTARLRTAYEVQHEPRPKPADAPNALWISTSFGWLLEIDAKLSNVFGELHLASYNHALYKDGVQGWVEVRAHTPEWRSVFLTRELVVLELHESYLTPGHFFGEDAVRSMLEELPP